MNKIFGSMLEYYKYIYNDSKNINSGTFWSNYKGARLLIEKSGIIKNYNAIYTLIDARDYLQDKKLEDSFPIWSNLSFLLHDYYNSIGDELIIIGAYEQYAKTILLENDIIIHKITEPKELSKKQNNNPIIFTDSTIQTDYNISENTIGMNSILKKNYQNIIGTDKNDILILKEMIKTRNRIHFQDIKPINIDKNKITFVYNLYKNIKEKEDTFVDKTNLTNASTL